MVVRLRAQRHTLGYAKQIVACIGEEGSYMRIRGERDVCFIAASAESLREREAGIGTSQPPTISINAMLYVIHIVMSG